MSSRTTPSATKKEVKRLAGNIGLALQEESRKSFSMAVCLDVMTTVLDKFMTTKEWKLNGEAKVFSDYLKEELEKRKQMSLPQTKPEEEKKEEVADPASNV